jgi:UDP-N-acetylmuramoylalanine--D-glutamate ligase
MKNDFNGKRLAIVGMARSGMAAADVLSRRGAVVTLYDGKSKEQLVDAIRWAEEKGITVKTSADAIGPADLAVVSPGVRLGSPIFKSIVDQNIEWWGEIEAAYSISDAPILGVTGTNGKTTVALLLAEMIRASGRTAFAAGNIAAGSLAQPLIAAADTADASDAIVAEISSFQLETIRNFKPAVAAILNITPDHQDRQTWTEYVDAKWRIFENQEGTDTAVLSSDTPPASHFAHLPANVVYYDAASAPEWIGRIKLLGNHSQLNVLAASSMAGAFGVDEESIKRAALDFKGVVHRLEFVAEVGGVAYINNSMCTNNAAFANSLEALPGEKIVLTGGVYKGGDMRQLADAVSRNNVRLVVAFGRSGPDIADIVRSETNVDVLEAIDIAESLALANEKAKKGDIVILSPGCSSFDQFKDFEERGDVFKSLVKSLGEVNRK